MSRAQPRPSLARASRCSEAEDRHRHDRRRRGGGSPPRCGTGGNGFGPPIQSGSGPLAAPGAALEEGNCSGCCAAKLRVGRKTGRNKGQGGQSRDNESAH